MDVVTILLVVVASLVSGIAVHIFDKNKDGSITKDEIEEVINEALKKN